MRPLLRHTARKLSSSAQPRLEAMRQKLARDSVKPAPPPPPPDARSFFIETRGCQMNVSDSEVIRTLLATDGLREADSAATADVVLLNTCAIRDKAEKKVWTRLRDLRGRRGVKGQTVAVLGCMAERVRDDLFRDGLADVIVGPDAYRRLPEMLRTQLPAMDIQLDRFENYEDLMPSRAVDNVWGAFVSIQRGCDNACSYCIVPYVRGRERSRSVQTIIDEVATLYDRGVREITLLGQNVNSYHDASADSVRRREREYATGFVPFVKSERRDALTGVRFAELLERCALAAPDARLRFVSPHPKDFPDDLLETVARVPNVAKQLHMPAQSGSDGVLKRMRRGYTGTAYRELIGRARARIPDVAISSDFIAGFCGESEADHRQTLALVEDTRFDMAFLYAYSSRDKTPAARRLEDDVPADVKKRRLQQLIDAFRAGRETRSPERVGRTHLVLVEGAPRRDRGEGLVAGRDDGNRVHVFPQTLPDGTDLAPGDFAHVLADRAEGATLLGVALRRAAGASDRPETALVDANSGAAYLLDEETGASRWVDAPVVAAASARPRPSVTAQRAFSTSASLAADAIEDILAAAARRAPWAVLGIEKRATGWDAKNAFLAASKRVHPDVCADARAGAAFAALVAAYDAFAPSDIKYDVSQAEFQGDALTTAAWMWDDAAAAARKHKARHTLDD